LAAKRRKKTQKEKELEQTNPSPARRSKSSLHVASLRHLALFAAIQLPFFRFNFPAAAKPDYSRQHFAQNAMKMRPGGSSTQRLIFNSHTVPKSRRDDRQ
jgi:hypothetical protein